MIGVSIAPPGGIPIPVPSDLSTILILLAIAAILATLTIGRRRR